MYSPTIRLTNAEIVEQSRVYIYRHHESLEDWFRKIDLNPNTGRKYFDPDGPAIPMAVLMQDADLMLFLINYVAERNGHEVVALLGTAETNGSLDDETLDAHELFTQLWQGFGTAKSTSDWQNLHDAD